jgi:type 2 lantibiotic biosynthesis protein LanM
MRAGEIGVPASLPLSLPVGIGSPNRLCDFTEEFCAGFEGQLLAIARARDEWTAEDGPLSRFRQLRRRHVARPTWLYRWLLDRQLEPAALRSDVSQRLTLETLARSYLVSRERPPGWPVFRSEVAQMERLDIPCFDQVIDSVDLLLPEGGEIAGYFRVSGYEQACEKIRRLDRAAIAFQVQLIRGVIAAKNRRPLHSLGGAPARTDGEPRDEVSDEDRVAEARALGRLVVDTAVADGTGALEWLGIDVAADVQRSRYGALGPSLYSGRAGIALFVAALAHSGRAEPDVYCRTALGASADLLRVAGVQESKRWWRDQALGLNGAGGVLLTLLRLAGLLPDLRDAIAEKVSSLLDALTADRLNDDRRVDVMEGSAGLIGPLLAVGTPRAMMLAEAAGDNLVARQDPGGGWLPEAMGSRPLTGFSHGASGMTAALARLDAALPRASYRQAVGRALRFEREAFDPVERNWPDLRPGYASQPHRFMLGWCHGAPGVAVSRLCLLGTSAEDAGTETELEDALTSTADARYAGDSLCCGRFGRAAILRLAAGLRDEARWLGPAAALEGRALATRRADGGYSFGDALGLFNGAAGVGLALLDATLAPDERVLPSVLSAGLSGASPRG